MNEVGGEAAYYLPRLRILADRTEWAQGGAKVLRDLLAESDEEKNRRRTLGYVWVKRFDPNRAIDGYLSIYQRIVEMEQDGRATDCDLNESTRS